jgi:Spy/CpxP family protein refolding chaperone
MRITIGKAATAAITALALSVPAAALASHGSDDPVGHVRHEHNGAQHHGRHHDDGARHDRRGNDDGPNHR